ncbi:MAG: hypothetical protein EBS76_09135 [Actinobacteria bacterium]|nr:hypothetical protein [Actinomycetota bacterium]
MQTSNLRRLLASLTLVLVIHTIAPQQVSAQASDDDAYGSTMELGEYFDGRIWSVVGIEANPSSNGAAIVAGAECIDDDDTTAVCLVGLNDDGSVDTTFGDNGVVIHAPTDTLTLGVVNRMQFDPQGRILVASFCDRYEGVVKYDYDTMDACITRYLSDGSVDTSFGTTADHVANAPMIRYQNPSALVFPDDGRIIAGGYCSSSPCLIGFTQDGIMDETFGDGDYEVGGSWIPDFDDGGLSDLALLPDGGYAGVGTCSHDDADVTSMCVIVWNEDGTRRTSFAENGVRSFVDGENSRGGSIVTLDDGTLISTGGCNFFPGMGSTSCLVGTNLDGSPATNFGTNGVVKTPEMKNINDLAGAFSNNPYAAVTLEHLWFSQPCDSGIYVSMCLSRTRYHSIPVETTSTTVAEITEEPTGAGEPEPAQEEEVVADTDESATAAGTTNSSESSSNSDGASNAAADENPSSGGSSTTIVIVVIVVLAIGAGAGLALTKRRPRS